MDIFKKLYDYQINRVKQIIDDAVKAQPHGTVFFGDSLIQSFDLTTYFPHLPFYNCGVNGATSQQLLLLHDDAIGKYRPKQVVLLIGTNDLGHKDESRLMDGHHQFDMLDIVYNMFQLIEIMNLKYTIEHIYIISPLPIGENKKKTDIRNNTRLRLLGKEFSNFANEFENVSYIDVFDDFLREGQLKAEVSIDGLHINEVGYKLLADKLQVLLNKKV